MNLSSCFSLCSSFPVTVSFQHLQQMTQGLASREQTHSLCNSSSVPNWSWTPQKEGLHPKKKLICYHVSKMCVHTEAKLRSYWHVKSGVAESFCPWLCNLNGFCIYIYKFWKEWGRWFQSKWLPLPHINSCVQYHLREPIDRSELLIHRF